MDDTDNMHADAAVIGRLGGPTVVARIFDIEPQAVSMWKRGGIPKARRMYLELVHPDAFKPAKEGEDSAA